MPRRRKSTALQLTDCLLFCLVDSILTVKWLPFHPACPIRTHPNQIRLYADFTIISKRLHPRNRILAKRKSHATLQLTQNIATMHKSSPINSSYGNSPCEFLSNPWEMHPHNVKRTPPDELFQVPSSPPNGILIPHLSLDGKCAQRSHFSCARPLPLLKPRYKAKLPPSRAPRDFVPALPDELFASDWLVESSSSRTVETFSLSFHDTYASTDASMEEENEPQRYDEPFAMTDCPAAASLLVRPRPLRRVPLL
jgi:hypothetical protein